MKKVLGGIFLSLCLVAGAGGYFLYHNAFQKNVPDILENNFILLDKDYSLDQLASTLFDQGVIIDTSTFIQTAKWMKYGAKVRKGRFEITPGSSNRELIRMLRSSAQSAIKLVVNYARTLEDVSSKLTPDLLMDSSALRTAMSNTELLEELGMTEETLMSIFIPNTYQVYWNSTPEDLLRRMKKESNTFWSKSNREEKRKELGLTRAEVYTLASIIEKETNQNSEKPRMAGALVNRLNINMLLQADPTAVFATRDFETKRVWDKHTKFDSPYNTYMYAGLPPGPIAMASIASIDAVLNYEKHKYLYYCAKGDGSGLHNFALNLSGHNQNIRVYKNNLRKRGL